ncbi:MAG: family transcriptional regulator, fatty acid utilization regulator [Frankiales bacterium]|jgi:transcriptional regulator with XRE-family HTH domain/predicted transcriptional regulator|nr:family transcriptional regulator, fatty acid utilization regulator [Frankiales bacterium]
MADKLAATSPDAGTTVLTLGRRIRHFRTAAGLTLDALAESTGTAASQLSLIENGHREPRLTLLQSIAAALQVELADLLDTAPPSRRAALEISLEAAQRTPLYAALKLPAVRAARTLPVEALEALVGLHAELARRSSEASATPEEARRANTALRRWMRERDNYLPEIEGAAEKLVVSAGYAGGPLTHRMVERIVEQLGFTLHHAEDLPSSARSVTDLEHRRIYVPPQSIPGGHGLRSLALQAVAHRVLGHKQPETYADFLHQRMEITYFAACCLMPQTAAVEFLQTARKAKDLAVEDFRDAFGVSHENAAHRFTNLATARLGIKVHYSRVGRDGTLFKGYENDGVRFASDVTGAIEGQTVCRHWTSRTVFGHADHAGGHQQYTDTPSGTFWCSALTGTGGAVDFSVTVGVPYTASKWFRGRETRARSVSTCPDPACCRQPSADLAQRWSQASWPSAKLHTHILGALPGGTFPGVDDAEVYQFLESHAPGRPL